MVAVKMMRQLAQVTATAVLVGEAAAQNSAQANITSDSYFYGQSPPVYPSPQQPGIGPWADAHTKAVALVAQMTPEERANITVGFTTTTGCSGETGSVPRLNWPGLCLLDSGNGVRNTDFVNGWSSGIHVGASFNRNLSYERAFYMGGEFKTKGVHVALGPAIGPLGRVAEGGRNWEGFSVDPYLSGQLVYESVKGIQEAGVTATTKHFIANEQELNRNPIREVASLSSNIDDKTMHETYLWPFADAVRAGTGAIMCSYNRINNSYASQNSKLLNGLLKTELGFEGFVVTDWGAQHTGIASALAGLDMVMPNSRNYWGPNAGNLTIAVNNGSMEDSRLTDMAVRIVASWYQMGQDEDFPELGVGMPRNILAPHAIVDARNPVASPIVLRSALEGHVLVKNVNNTLPLNKPKIIGVFGYDAPAPSRYNVGAQSGDTPNRWQFGYDSVLNYLGFLSTTAPAPPFAANGTLTSGGGSGAALGAYISAPLDAIQQQAYLDGTQVYWDTISANPLVNGATDACLVFINAFASEGPDRTALYDDYSDALVQNVAANCSNTIVTIHNAGIRLIDQWIENPNVTAVIFAHLPGQDSGRAAVQILYGLESPSGKLPYTVAKNESDYNVLKPDQPTGQYQRFPQGDFIEGVYHDYRDFDRKNITPRYEFGFGLSYTTFEFADLSVAKADGAVSTYLPPGSNIIEGGVASLHDVLARVTAVVHNTGDVDAMEVAQLYVGIPGGPVRQLRGFEKVSIAAGDSATVSFDLVRKDLSEWSVEEQSWVLQEGNYNVYVGSSSRDLPLTGTLTF
ncbi:putative beta-glucosidase M [Amylocarpus encephaloides]|uniref:beta-glucosidase n=1 Tax=Amylocarpus encephaloides TaxID=45428 RepID=A0A9P8C207_9HELO|nr:putative beta-glucosidase M [Amylocarpus encephaloides]